jgi:hypothetical protein
MHLQIEIPSFSRFFGRYDNQFTRCRKPGRREADDSHQDKNHMSERR